MIEALQAAWHAVSDIHNVRIYMTVLYVVYLVGLGGWIVLQKREPVATVSWLLGLALLPYIGFIVYNYFGPQRIKRHRLRRARSKAPMLPPSAADDPIARELSRLGMATTGLPPTTAREVRMIVDGHAKYTALLADIAQ